MMLIYPPVSKPSEAPPGVAALAGALKNPVLVIDANLQGLQHLLEHNVPDSRPQAYRVWKARHAHWRQLQQPAAYRTVHHYNRLVSELERVLSASPGEHRVGLADYTDGQRSPIQSADLIREAEQPQRNAFYAYYSDALLPQIEINQPDWIGISINYMSQALPAFALIGMLKARWPHLPLAIGGGLVSSWMSLENWDGPFQGLVNQCIPGPGEAALAHWTGSILQSHSLPDYTQTPLSSYLAPESVLPIAASRGCFWRRCRFCPETAEKSQYIPQPPRLVLDQLKQLIHAHQPGIIHFVDSAISPALIQTLFDQDSHFPWYGYLRFDDQLLNFDFCVQLKKSGCRLIKLGLESGSQSVLDALEKGIDILKAGKILNNLRNAGIMTYVYVLFGTPAESFQDALETLDFVQKHADCITYLNTALFLLPRQSPLTASVSTMPFSRGDLSLYTNFDHPRGWDRQSVRHFIDRQWKRDPLIAAILRRTPKVFTSSHAAFFQY